MWSRGCSRRRYSHAASPAPTHPAHQQASTPNARSASRPTSSKTTRRTTRRGSTGASALARCTPSRHRRRAREMHRPNKCMTPKNASPPFGWRVTAPPPPAPQPRRAPLHTPLPHSCSTLRMGHSGQRRGRAKHRHEQCHTTHVPRVTLTAAAPHTPLPHSGKCIVNDGFGR